MPIVTIDRLFAYIIPRKEKVIFFFKIIYLIQIAVFLAAARVLYIGGPEALYYYQLGVGSGKIAVILFILTLIPGMMRRFGITHKLLSLLMIFRRYIGIAMYVSALAHFGLVKVVPILSLKLPFRLAFFEFWGSLALFSLFFLFITSNDFSTAKLGVWWHRTHKLIYLSMWFILLHVGLQRISLWTVLMGATVLLMMASFLVSKLRGK